MKAYIAGPITGVDNLLEVFAWYEKIGDLCEEHGIEPFVPHLNNKFSASEESIYEVDINGVINSDLVIAHIGESSTGVGIELGVALSNGKSIIGFYYADENPSVMVLGMLRTYDKGILCCCNSPLYRSTSWQLVIGRLLRVLTGKDIPWDKEEAIWSGRLEEHQKAVEKYENHNTGV